MAYAAQMLPALSLPEKVVAHHELAAKTVRSARLMGREG